MAAPCQQCNHRRGSDQNAQCPISSFILHKCVPLILRISNLIIVFHLSKVNLRFLLFPFLTPIALSHPCFLTPHHFFRPAQRKTNFYITPRKILRSRTRKEASPLQKDPRPPDRPPDGGGYRRGQVLIGCLLFFPPAVKPFGLSGAALVSCLGCYRLASVSGLLCSYALALLCFGGLMACAAVFLRRWSPVGLLAIRTFFRRLSLSALTACTAGPVTWLSCWQLRHLWPCLSVSRLTLQLPPCRKSPSGGEGFYAPGVFS